MSWRDSYWRGFNVLVRVVGLLAFLAGALWAVWGTMRIFRLGVREIEGMMPGVVLLAAGILAAALGAAMLRAATYRPDLGDVSWQFDPFGSKSRGAPGSGRSWWTGDPR
jgi:hypothetical protein